MTVRSDQDLRGLRRAGRVVTDALHAVRHVLEPGITTREMDEVGARFLAACGARPAPTLTYGFPGAACISVGDEVAHGVPGDRVVQAGDLVNIDVSAELDGYFADTGASIPVPPVPREVHTLCAVTRLALRRGVAAVRAGARMNGIGRAIETVARRAGYRVIKDLCGHGVGRALHEEPGDVLNYYWPGDTRRLTEGLVLTIEPFLSRTTDRAIPRPNGWTLATADGSLAAQFEHTVVVTRRGAIVVT